MSPYQTIIAPSTLAENLHESSLRIVDCRFSLMQPDQGSRDHAAGHIPGAVYASLDEDLAAAVSGESGRHPLPAVATFVATLRRWGISNDSQLVVYDDAGGGVAARLWWMLRWLGHRDVALLDGGFAAWTRAACEVSQDDTPPDEGSFVGSAAPEKIWTTADIVSWLDEKESFRLVDARDGARFRGEHEPIDPVAGHVPGATNLPFTASLRADGTWRSPDEIRSCWAGVIGPREEKAWGVMCGSGVTACHLALSAAIAGLPEPRLYVGSWSEWVRDAARPVATESRDQTGM